MRVVETAAGWAVVLMWAWFAFAVFFTDFEPERWFIGVSFAAVAGYRALLNVRGRS